MQTSAAKTRMTTIETMMILNIVAPTPARSTGCASLTVMNSNSMPSRSRESTSFALRPSAKTLLDESFDSQSDPPWAEHQSQGLPGVQFDLFPRPLPRMRFWYDSTPRIAQGACGFLLLCCRGLKSVFLGSLFLGSVNLLFGLEPVVEFRTRLTTSLDMEFVGSAPDSFFERKRLDRRFLRACGFWHEGLPPGLPYHRRYLVGVFKQVTNLAGQIRGMRSRICQGIWVSDLAGCARGLVLVVRVLAKGAGTVRLARRRK